MIEVDAIEGGVELISQTIDQIFEPDVPFHAPVPTGAAGTHLGEYMGLPPTGRSITYDEIFICRFANGRIAEVWGVVDVFSQMKQLGLAPA
jgi:SnoaL-like polyketide cyclase